MSDDKVRFLDTLKDSEPVKNPGTAPLQDRLKAAMTAAGLPAQMRGCFRDLEAPRPLEFVSMAFSIFDRRFRSHAGARKPIFRHLDVKREISRIVRDAPECSGLVRWEQRDGSFIYSVYLDPKRVAPAAPSATVTE